MIEPIRPLPFIEPVAVEAWDVWFRWRDGTALRDVSIDDTWQRVADALASVERADVRDRRQARFMQAFASWQLLPDERVLAAAGTGHVNWRGEALHAVLNAAAFVPAGPYPAVGVDLIALGDCAELAVRALDNAAVLAGTPAPRLRVGMVGVADALLLLGLSYDSPAGRGLVGTLLRALAAGCFRANVELAVDRGRAAGDTTDAVARALSRGMTAEWVADAERHGLRYAQLTAITSQSRLALLANDVADALDPLSDKRHAYAVAGVEEQRIMYSSGYALNMLQRGGSAPDARSRLPTSEPWTAQMAMRAVAQPWMDEPIACPLLLDGKPSPAQRAAARRQAARHGLAPPTWRSPAQGPLPIAPRRCGGMDEQHAESTA